MRQVRTAAALSEHPLATHAVGECVGQLLERGGTDPDLLVLSVTEPYAGALEDIVAATRLLLEPAVLLGTTAQSVLGGGREVEERGAISLFAMWSDGSDAPLGSTGPSRTAAPVQPVRLGSVDGPHGAVLIDPERFAGADGTLIVFADPFTAPMERLLSQLRDVAPDLVVVGGMASSGRHPGGNRLVLDDEMFTDHAVAAWISPEVRVDTVVSQGCRPIGEPMTVTRAERNVIYELAGRSALERLMELLETLSPEDRQLAAGGLHIGRVIDEHAVEFDRGDFLIRNVLGGDRDAGAIAIGDQVELGSTVQFQVRDARTAGEDLAVMMGDRAGARGALVFTCNGRGTRLFGVPDHDALAVSEALDGAPVAGMACAGEFGPIGRTSFVHGLTASVLLFG